MSFRRETNYGTYIVIGVRYWRNISRGIDMCQNGTMAVSPMCDTTVIWDATQISYGNTIVYADRANIVRGRAMAWRVPPFCTSVRSMSLLAQD